MTDTAAETAQKNPNLETVQASTTTPVAKVASEKLELDEKDVFASPPAKEKQEEHDIVERSPGGRYLRFVERLGSGAYKDVYRAYDTIQGIEVAWNQVNLSGIPKSDKIRIINEVRLLEKLNHSNIISFHGSWVNREKETVIFVTEIMSSGTLKMFMKKVQVIRLNVAKGGSVSHRDLKCDNIFINGTSGDLRIGDLGLSTAISKSKALSVLGTPEFMAPELYDENYDEKVDIYAFGMCLLEIFTKEVPYHECSNPAQIYKKVTNQIEPVSLSKVQISEAQELIRLCINTDPTKRPTAAELLNHPFLGPNASDAETEIIVVDDRALSPIAEKVGNASSTSHTAAGSSVSDVNVTKSMTKSSTAIDVAQSSDVIQEEHGAADTTSATTTTTTENDVLLDSLSEMQLQEKESSMGKSVKALMGRPDEAAATTTAATTTNEQEMNSSAAEEGAATATAATKQQETSSESSSSSSSQYVVAAECMEEVVTDNLMKLIISIPIQNETQHVQFDFHLVKDDPIQVAREMVTELHIPQQAILEISETISGLARDARVNLEKQNKRQAVQEPTDLLSLEETEQNGANASASAQTNGTNSADIAKSVSAPNLNEAGENVNVPMKRNISADNPQQQRPQQQQQQQQKQQQQPQHATTVAAGPAAVTATSVSCDDEIDLASEADVEEEELRRLGEEYRKNRERANKAYDTRMDNLKRSRDEKVAQHKKFLEKHEREMDEFDKRLKQIEVDQTKRLKELENGWNKQREELLESKRKMVQNGSIVAVDGAQHTSLGTAAPVPGQMHVESSASTVGTSNQLESGMMSVQSASVSSGGISSAVSGADLSLLDR
eukprot:CAMPEP_0116013304 /NCGR_PEP_ID=MMETSP0321-20121206/5650_1 /TAXON_ID=163516 /ORGANISM="Leptocylindrus danicus var. danicus, Strain B650" /LENGTH=837 /DNA_ID=CAMNT_0003482835 /DNA_START=24 /DNA_END=2538 /DNA_ORIENTATION=+